MDNAFGFDYDDEYFEANGNWTSDVYEANYRGPCGEENCEICNEHMQTTANSPIFKWDEDSIIDTLAFIEKLAGGK